MEEYLPDITNDMIVCQIQAASVINRSEIWKMYLTARDGYKREADKYKKPNTEISVIRNIQIIQNIIIQIS